MYFSSIIVISNITGVSILQDNVATTPWHLQRPHETMTHCQLFARQYSPDGSVNFFFLNICHTIKCKDKINLHRNQTLCDLYCKNI